MPSSRSGRPGGARRPFIPVVTLIGLQLPILVGGGSVIILVFVLVSIFAIFKLRDGLLVDSSMLLWQ